VLTVIVLLRPDANSPSLTGTFELSMPDGWQTNRYNYRVVRLWQEDPESYLTAGVNLVPLAPLTNVSEADLRRIVGRMADRINAEPRPKAAKLWTATYLLMGLRYSDVLTVSLLEGVQVMKESTTYQKILREGRKEGRKKGQKEGRVSEARRMLLRQGAKRFGAPDAATIAALEAIQDIDRLEALGERILDPEIRDWAELIQTP
jgi:predicted transposase YdaD